MPPVTAQPLAVPRGSHVLNATGATGHHQHILCRHDVRTATTAGRLTCKNCQAAGKHLDPLNYTTTQPSDRTVCTNNCASIMACTVNAKTAADKRIVSLACSTMLQTTAAFLQGTLCWRPPSCSENMKHSHSHMWQPNHTVARPCDSTPMQLHTHVRDDRY
jgi:hypothetical protein